MQSTSFLPHNDANLAYRHTQGAGPMLVFLPGYMSDMTGSKAEAVAEWAAANGRACLRLDYSGCGASGGDFLAGSIGHWTDDARAIIDHVAPGAPVVVIGSSMGGWIALRLGMALGTRLAGLVGIAAAPDFTTWGLELSAADRDALATNGWFTRPSGYDPAGYRYSRAFIDDAANQLVLDAEIAIDCPVRLLHGQQDDAVPWKVSLDIAARLRSTDVHVLLVKDGDHRLSRDSDIARLLATLKDLS
jgi:pimeloyl-ACP methyl ester carboxylesterase